jgi:hypothetical protein
MLLDFVHRLLFLKKTTFRKLNLFPSSGKLMAAPTLLGPLEGASLNHWAQFAKSCLLGTLDDGNVQKTDSSKCDSPSIKILRTHKNLMLLQL